MDIQHAQEQIDSFAKMYSYDTGYLSILLHGSEGAFEAFSAGQGMSTFRKNLSLEAHYVARVSAMRAADCGPCAQLNLRMAVEEGVSRELLGHLLDDPSQMPEPLRDVADHAREVVEGQITDLDRVKRLRWTLGEEAFAELAVNIAGCLIYPLAKRALSQDGVCERLTLDF